MLITMLCPLAEEQKGLCKQGSSVAFEAAQKEQITPGALALSSLTNLILPNQPAKLSQSSLSAGAGGVESQQNSFSLLKKLSIIMLSAPSSFLLCFLFHLELSLLTQSVTEDKRVRETFLPGKQLKSLTIGSCSVLCGFAGITGSG